MADLAPPPCIGETSVRRTWIIAVQPGRVPEEKRPPDQSHEGVETFLREMMACRPEGTRYVIASLSYGFDLWTQDGQEYLAMTEPRKRRKRKSQ